MSRGANAPNKAPARTLPSSSGQDARLSRRKQGFNSPRERHDPPVASWRIVAGACRTGCWGDVEMAGSTTGAHRRRRTHGPRSRALAHPAGRPGAHHRQERGPGQTSRAMAVQARTLELYRQLDLAAAVVAAGSANPVPQPLGRRQATRPRRSSRDAGGGHHSLSLRPGLSAGRARAAAGRAAPAHRASMSSGRPKLVDFSDDGERVHATLRRPDGGEEARRGRLPGRMRRGKLAGPPQDRRDLRRAAPTGSSSTSPTSPFSGLEPADEIHIALDSADFLAVLSYGDGMRHRLIGTVRDERGRRSGGPGVRGHQRRGHPPAGASRSRASTGSRPTGSITASPTASGAAGPFSSATPPTSTAPPAARE